MISRPIREGFRGVGRHWAMSFSSAIAVTITLLIISLFLIFTFNVQNFTRGIEQSVDIYASVSFDHESSEDEQKIRTQIEAIEGVGEVQFNSKAEEFDYYLNSFEDERVREIFSPFSEEENPFHDAFYVKAASGEYIQSVAEAIDQIDGIYEVNYGGETTVSLVNSLSKIRYFGAIVAAALSLLAIFLIQNTIKLTIYARQDEITIMRNVGATNRFIRSPFVIEGALIGAMGSIIPIAASWYGYQALIDVTGGYLFSKIFTLLPVNPWLYYLCGALLIIGILVGLIGSYLSVTKYLRLRR